MAPALTDNTIMSEDRTNREVNSKNYSTSASYPLEAENKPLNAIGTLDIEREAEFGLDIDKEDLTMEDDFIEDDDDLEAIKARVREMEEEALKYKLKTCIQDKMKVPSSQYTTDSTLKLSLEADSRSCYIGNVHYTATAEELEKHFSGCGNVNRVTILCNKFNGYPKGFAYIEFAEKDAIDMAITLNGSLFKGRRLKVMLKRTNEPGIHSYFSKPPMYRGRGGFRGRISGYRGRGGFRYIRGFRSRGRGNFYSPY